ncbi:hypothetical protein C8R46DRAFT_12406 [Mycena filopes]|nr:hypothetical protein C8R46DRAFT_12406 [Mycena filopes]
MVEHHPPLESICSTRLVYLPGRSGPFGNDGGGNRHDGQSLRAIPQQPSCRAPHSFAYLACATLLSQAILLGLTLLRFLQGQWGGTSLGHLLIRDGSIVYIVFFMSTMAAAIYSVRGLAFGMTEYA